MLKFDGSVATNFLKSKVSPSTPTPGTESEPAVNADGTSIDPRTLPPVSASLGWDLHQKVDMHVYLTTSNIFVYWEKGRNGDHGLPNFVWENITFGNYNEHRVHETNIDFPKVRKRLLKNAQRLTTLVG